MENVFWMSDLGTFWQPCESQWKWKQKKVICWFFLSKNLLPVNSCPENSTTRVTLVLSLCAYYTTLYKWVTLRNTYWWVRRMSSYVSFFRISICCTHVFLYFVLSLVTLQGSWNRVLCFHLAIGILLQKKRNKNKELKYQHNILNMTSFVVQGLPEFQGFLCITRSFANILKKNVCLKNNDNSKI